MAVVQVDKICISPPSLFCREPNSSLVIITILFTNTQRKKQTNLPFVRQSKRCGQTSKERRLLHHCHTNTKKNARQKNSTNRKGEKKNTGRLTM
ncbi:hypothetical protein, unlikely [Trypanosoma brucei brucei TREU927]|uniref:Uncharacterized protein n=1 Tax=Trypanosoma brucei brucei (strain 927/4 GUTat10.1) TaxID=185431 RepID=Q38F01_TRYB2|nr:hypothetical protein, unlikely [Trypanosoma brucei brucei TREU927]EAN76619.1 hypothetical protein, unlikely [Trypanosoma brucei brucei TREU927]